jgi:hypothetical protein
LLLLLLLWWFGLWFGLDARILGIVMHAAQSH